MPASATEMVLGNTKLRRAEVLVRFSTRSRPITPILTNAPPGKWKCLECENWKPQKNFLSLEASRCDTCETVRRKGYNQNRKDPKKQCSGCGRLQSGKAFVSSRLSDSDKQIEECKMCNTHALREEREEAQRQRREGFTALKREYDNAAAALKRKYDSDFTALRNASAYYRAPVKSLLPLEHHAEGTHDDTP